MDWMDLYRETFEKLVKAKKFKFLTAYNVNIDKICRVRGNNVAKLIEEENYVEKHGYKRKINFKGDFLSGLLYHMRTGKGGEALIIESELCDWLEKNFLFEEETMGGNAGNMASTLSKLSMRVIVNVPQLTEDQANLFECPENIFIPTIKGGKILCVPVLKAIRRGDESVVHYIFEFRRGDKIELKDELINVKQNNRFIASYDSYNTLLWQDPAFNKISPDLIRSIDACLISGFHLLREINDNLRKSQLILRKWKKINPDLKIHVELADFQEPQVLEYVVKNFSFVDSYGMNETELMDVSSLFGEKLKDTDVLSLLKGSIKFYEESGINKIIIHTPEYSFGLYERDDPEKIKSALILGSLLAACRAKRGSSCSKKDLGTLLKIAKINEIGLEKVKILRDEIEMNCPEMKGKIQCCPSLDVGPIKSTVGLGDCFAAGFVLGEVIF